MGDYLNPLSTAFPELHYGTTTLSTEVKKEKYGVPSSSVVQQIDDRLHLSHNNSKSIPTRTS